MDLNVISTSFLIADLNFYWQMRCTFIVLSLKIPFVKEGRTGIIGGSTENSLFILKIFKFLVKLIFITIATYSYDFSSKVIYLFTEPYCIKVWIENNDNNNDSY